MEKLIDNPPCDGATKNVDISYLRDAVSKTLSFVKEMEQKEEDNGDNFLPTYIAIERIYNNNNYTYQEKDGSKRNYLFDIDGDGIYDGASPSERAAGIIPDSFPGDPDYAADNDNDGVPNQLDAFPNDADKFLPDGIFKGKPVLETTIYLERDADTLSKNKFKQAMNRWQSGINGFIQKNLSDNSVGWKITFKDASESPNGERIVKVYGVRVYDEGDFYEADEFNWYYKHSLETICHESGHHEDFPDRYSDPNLTDVRDYLYRNLFFGRQNDLMNEGGRIYVGDVKFAIAQKRVGDNFKKAEDLSWSTNDAEECIKYCCNVLAVFPEHPKAKKILLGAFEKLLAVSWRPVEIFKLVEATPYLSYFERYTILNKYFENEFGKLEEILTKSYCYLDWQKIAAQIATLERELEKCRFPDLQEKLKRIKETFQKDCLRKGMSRVPNGPQI